MEEKGMRIEMDKRMRAADNEGTTERERTISQKRDGK